MARAWGLLLTILVSLPAMGATNSRDTAEGDKASSSRESYLGNSNRSVIEVAGGGWRNSRTRFNYVEVRGCSSSAAFQLAYCNRGCQCNSSLKMNVDLANAVNQSFQECVQQGVSAAGVVSCTNFTGKIDHKGCLGDGSHRAKGRSLHNHGRALDIKAVHVCNRSFDFGIASRDQSSSDFRFFKQLRTCWATAAEKASAGCEGMAERAAASKSWFATIGWEDKNHYASHLHVSVPYCGSERARHGTYLFAELLGIKWAFAQSASKDAGEEDSAPLELERKSFEIAGVGSAEVRIVDEEEPVDRPISVSVDLICKKTGSRVKVVEEFSVCRYHDAKYDAKKKAIVLSFFGPDMKDGEIVCTEKESREFPAACP